MDAVATQLVKGLKGAKVVQRRPDSTVIKTEKGKTVAELLTRKKGLRVNFRHALPKGAPAELKNVVQATASARQWAAFAECTADSAKSVRKAIELALGANPVPARPRKRTTSTRVRSVA